MDSKKEACMATDVSIAHLISSRDSMNKTITDAQISIKKLTHKINSFYAEREKATKTVQHLSKENPWIPKEEQYVMIHAMFLT